MADIEGCRAENGLTITPVSSVKTAELIGLSSNKPTGVSNFTVFHALDEDKKYYFYNGSWVSVGSSPT